MKAPFQDSVPPAAVTRCPPHVKRMVSVHKSVALHRHVPRTTFHCSSTQLQNRIVHPQANQYACANWCHADFWARRGDLHAAWMCTGSSAVKTACSTCLTELQLTWHSFCPVYTTLDPEIPKYCVQWHGSCCAAAHCNIFSVLYGGTCSAISQTSTFQIKIHKN